MLRRTAGLCHLAVAGGAGFNLTRGKNTAARWSNLSSSPGAGGLASPSPWKITTTSTTTALQRRQYSSNSKDDDDFDDEEEEEEGFTFDSDASMAKDVKKSQQGDIIDRIIKGILGADNVTEEASAKVKEYLVRFPINNAIVADKVKVTHTLDDKGATMKCNLPDMSFEDALAMAKENKLDLVQLSSRDGLAFCRMRDETTTIRKLVDGASVPGSSESGQNDRVKKAASVSETQAATNLYKYPKGFKLSNDIGDVELTDKSDDHFCQWKGKKVVEALKKGHGIRITIKSFETPDQAVAQLKKFIEAIKRNASDPVTVPFHCPQVKAAYDSVAVLLQPVDPAKQPYIKVLTDRDWDHHTQRLNEETGGKGTYKRRGPVKEAKNLNASWTQTEDGHGVTMLDKETRKKMFGDNHYSAERDKRKASGDFWKQ